mgnify:CR=1 FL=1
MLHARSIEFSEMISKNFLWAEELLSRLNLAIIINKDKTIDTIAKYENNLFNNSVIISFIINK